METLGTWLHEQRRLRLVEVLVRRAIRVLALVFVAAVALRIFGVALGIGGSALLLAAALLLAFLSPILRPVRIAPLGLDRELGARDALATCLAAGERGRQRLPALELVAHGLAALVGSRRTRSRARRRIKRLGRSLFRLLLLLLLAILILPGGRPSGGKGVKPGVGDAPSPTAGGGPPPTSGGASDRPADESGESRPEPPEQDRQEDAGKTKPPARSEDRGERVVPFVVFPRFDDGQGRSDRAAPRIQRSPRGTSSKDRTKASHAATAEQDAAIEEWRRQSERAMARGVLPSWEASWLALYGSCLDRLGRSAKGR